ncbi:LysE family translocator [Motiliproteus coralliicola]|uniref:LysE family translocator n=1 Tax=Motiliproteus coralliicola TaxID=2283196 RepID=UPI001A9E4263|nr:LysE family translocator [Motiliproteus coralliicola]
MLSVQAVVALLFFSLSMSITPGAGNLTLLGISNRYGFAAALPFVAGTAAGVLVVFVGATAGLVSLFDRYPELYQLLKVAGALYLLYLSWGIAFSRNENAADESQPSGFVSGALVQLLNPKAWIAAMTVLSQFADPTEHFSIQIGLIIGLFLLVMTGCTLSWAYFGAILKRLLSSPQQMRWINRGLGLTLAMTVVYMLVQTG